MYESAGILLGLCLYFPLYAECILQYAVGKRCPLSYWYGFTDNALSNLRIQPILCNDFNPTTKKILKIQDEAGRKPGASVWTYINEQIKIATLFSLIASYRAKYSDIRCAMFGGNTSDVFSFLVKKFLIDHENHLWFHSIT